MKNKTGNKNNGIINSSTNAIVNNEDTKNDETDITPEEKKLLDSAGENSGEEDDERLKEAELDNTDEDGELLNEKSSADDVSGKDLDVPGAEADDRDEAIGEEDEENNDYSGAEEQNE